MAFDKTPLFREVGETVGMETAYPRTLRIKVSDARAGGVVDVANVLIISAGTIRFGQDDAAINVLEDPTNENNEYAEVDSDEPRTVMLNLRIEHVQGGDEIITKHRLIGSASLAAFGNIGVTTSGDVFGCAVDNALTVLEKPTGGPNEEPVEGLYLFSDVSAERAGVEGYGSQINRMAYQSWALMLSPGDPAK